MQAAINLIPRERLLSRLRHERFRFWAAACSAYLVLLGAALGACYAVWGNHNAPLSQQVEQTQRSIAESTQKIKRINIELPKVVAALEASRAMGNQPDWSVLLTVLTKTLGDTIVLNNCRLELAGHTSPAPDGQTRSNRLDVPLGQRSYKLTLTGLGQTQTAVSHFVLRLERIELFKEVKLIKCNRCEFLNAEAVAFTVECRV